jgi:RNA polymerase sigma-70 factor (ECF subfamily)
MELPIDDREAIRQCARGSAAAFQVLVERYQREAFAHALALLGTPEDAADAVQEAFLDVFVALPNFDRTRPFYPWLYVVLRNRCFQALRTRKRRADAQDGRAVRLELIASPSTGAYADLEEALWSVSPEDREILTLRHFDGLTYAELAERLSIPQGTVMSRLYYARTRLRLALEATNCKSSDRVSHE